MKSIKLLIIPSLLLIGQSVALCKDFGIQGNVWPIVEHDIRQDIIESANQVDWKKAQSELKENAVSFSKRLPKRAFSVSEEWKTVWMDPSIELVDDIRAPMRNDKGDLEWKILYPKGTRVNPLDTNRPVTAMFFFNGNDPEQVEFLKDLIAKNPHKILPIEAGEGNVEESAKEFKIPVFYAQDFSINKFNITNLPALVYPGDAPHQNFIGTTFFPKPFKSEQVMSIWKGFSLNYKGTSGTESAILNNNKKGVSK